MTATDNTVESRSATQRLESIPTLLSFVTHDDRARMVRASVSVTTWDAYVSDLLDYSCFVGNGDWASPLILADYVETLGSVGAKFTTIERRISAVSKLVSLAAHCGFPNVVNPGASPLVRTRLSVVRRRVRDDVDCATPLIGRLRNVVLASIDVTKTAGLRDAALISVGWWGAMRRGELSSMTRRGIEFFDGGMAISLRSTKTSQTSTVTVRIPKREGSALCPVSLLTSWMHHSTELSSGVVVGRGRGDVWLRVNKHDGVYQPAAGISGDAVRGILDRRIKAAGLPDASGYSAHSLRSGFITEAKGQGIDEAAIMRHTRHKSVQVMRSYDRPIAEDLSRNAAAQLAD